MFTLFFALGCSSLDTILHIFLTTLECRRRISFLDLLAMLWLKQPGMWLNTFTTRVHCRVMLNLLFTRTIMSFPDNLTSNHSFPSLYWCMGLFLHKHKIWHFFLLNSMRFMLTHFSSLSKSLWMATQLSCISASPDFVSFVDLHSVSLSWSLEVVNTIGSSSDPC